MLIYGSLQHFKPRVRVYVYVVYVVHMLTKKYVLIKPSINL